MNMGLSALVRQAAQLKNMQRCVCTSMFEHVVALPELPHYLIRGI
jgi:hypothetical protein